MVFPPSVLSHESLAAILLAMILITPVSGSDVKLASVVTGAGVSMVIEPEAAVRADSPARSDLTFPFTRVNGVVVVVALISTPVASEYVLTTSVVKLILENGIGDVGVESGKLQGRYPATLPEDPPQLLGFSHAAPMRVIVSGVTS